MSNLLYNPGVEDNAVQSFDFNGWRLRGLLIDGEPWFIAKDVAESLGYRMASDMTRRLDEDEKGTRSVRTPGGEQNLTIISEPGLYEAIIGSQVEGAKTFKRWVKNDVLPAIRKTGSYAVEKQPETALEWAEKFIETERARLALASQLEAAQPAISGYESFLDSKRQLHISTVSKTYKAAGLNIGRSFSEVLRGLGLIYDSRRNNPIEGFWNGIARRKRPPKWRANTDAVKAGLVIEIDDSKDDYSSWTIRITPKGFFHIYEQLCQAQGVKPYPRSELLHELAGEGSRGMLEVA